MLYLFYVYFSYMILFVVVCITKNQQISRCLPAKTNNQTPAHPLANARLNVYFVLCMPKLFSINTLSINARYSIPIRADDLLNERAKNKLLQEEMEATLHDIQNM